MNSMKQDILSTALPPLSFNHRFILHDRWDSVFPVFKSRDIQSYARDRKGKLKTVSARFAGMSTNNKVAEAAVQKHPAS